ncbi:MAG: hypothetical protein K6F50_01895 [Kiritimatiellae bacterium]|nr:hypothetical protein [Kiritimatiellia bacterium]
MKKLIASIAIAVASAAFAGETPVMVSLVTPVQAPDSSHDVKGLRLSLVYGDCGEFTGLDLGIANRTRGNFTGLGIGGVNIASGRVYGGHVGLVNWSDYGASGWEDVSKGCQIGLFNRAGSFCGLQDGIVNISGGTFTGLQSGLFNSAVNVNGVSCGCYLFLGVNVATGRVRGCQLGLVNYAAEMECGVQIGLVNIIDRGGWMPVFPIVNGSF